MTQAQYAVNVMVGKATLNPASPAEGTPDQMLYDATVWSLLYPGEKKDVTGIRPDRVIGNDTLKWVYPTDGDDVVLIYLEVPGMKRWLAWGEYAKANTCPAGGG